ncbi:DUF4826 family protein [Pseudoalteromonas denitrificans]|uniref:DUF4826 domain-containing protein n=1 Tax=Pseudoalteromonas denitrificans DSM 6059 TaxID=1123010 RepID=A0A1I1PEQ6_9GAMM|nr:DUF4826 family protein [Pseudoalteromonas denitrificans]SFD06118.1 protein of unknown function [Pseudoalteromonas denitrificans DSM 6059]
MSEQEQKSQSAQQRQLTQEENIAWQRETFQNAQKHLAQKGILPKTVIEKESRYLAPFFAVWKIKSENGKTYWVISGQLPTDHAEITAAVSAREAIRYFSFQWQLKADQIIKMGAKDKTQVDFANLLVNRAHSIYEFYEKDELWGNE